MKKKQGEKRQVKQIDREKQRLKKIEKEYK